MTIDSSTVSVSTSSPSGFRLYLGMTGTNSNTNALVHTVDSNKTIASTGTLENPAALTNGKWGYAISGTRTADNPVVENNGFDATYTTQESTTPTSAKFASIPISTAPATKIAETNNFGDTNLTVYYGIRAGYETASGSYTNKVLYTALADDAPTLHTATITPDTILDTGGETITITTPLYTTVQSYEANAYLLTETEYQAVTRTTNPDPISTYASSEMSCTKIQTDALILQCTTIEIESGTAYVYVDIPHFSEYYAAPITVEQSTPQFFRITNMQDMTTDICNSVTTPNASATNIDTDGSHIGDPTYVAQHTLSDVRDNNTYTVRKLADGNCWMSENLRLNGGTTITPANSDVSSNFTLATAQTSGATVWSGDTNHVYSTGDFRLYSWYTATAGSGAGMSSGDAPNSICPKGWGLPPATGNKSFLNLLNGYYGIPGPYVGLVDYYGKLTSFPLNHQDKGNAGIYCGNGLGGCGYVTYVSGPTYGYWNKTVYDASHVYHFSYPYMGINHWGGWGASTNSNRDWGTSVRCVNK